MIPPVSERENRPCDNPTCICFQLGSDEISHCFLRDDFAFDWLKGTRLNGIPCPYHMTIEEYKELHDMNRKVCVDCGTDKPGNGGHWVRWNDGARVCNDCADKRLELERAKLREGWNK